MKNYTLFEKISVLFIACVIFLIISAILSGCGSVEDSNTEEFSKKIYEKIGSQTIGLNTVYEFKHIETGCHYTIAYFGSSGDIEQMYKKDANGNRVPYCD